MPALYDGFCYSTLIEAADAEISSQTLVTSSGLMIPNSYVVTDSLINKITITYNSKPSYTDSTVNFSLSRKYPICTNPGPYVTSTMMTSSDATELAWSVIACFALAYCIKLIRRSL